MDLYSKEGCIGVFDSGAGGISVLKALRSRLPQEDFVYVADSVHCPYGSKRDEEVLCYALDIAADLFDRGAKALVVACNTATSAAVAPLREIYPGRIIVGSEPALKPAVKDPRNTRILVMGTSVTLRREKYLRLLERFQGSEGVEIYSCPCPGLAERIDRENLDAPDLLDLIRQLIGDYAGRVNAVVLGCTHYPFVKKEIKAVLGDFMGDGEPAGVGGVEAGSQSAALPSQVRFYDGAAGCSKRLLMLLEDRDLLADRDRPGTIELTSTSADTEELARYQRFLSLDV